MNVDITNVLGTNPYDLAQWLSINMLSTKLPVPGPNRVVNIATEIMPLMAVISNNILLTTELYNICVGAKAPWTILKKDPDKKVQAEGTITTLSAHIDMLYRTLQTLESTRETASRLMTGINNMDRLNR